MLHVFVVNRKDKPLVATSQDVITRVANYPKPIETVWNALTTPENLVRWMCTDVKPYDLTPGAMLRMSWNDEHFQDARIVTVDPPKTFAWEWHPGGDFDSSRPLDEQGPFTTVTFTLEPTDAGTRLTMVESGFAALSAERHAQAMADNNGGWDGCIGNLTRLMENDLGS